MNLKSQPKKKKKKPDPKIRILHFYEVLEYLICGDRNQNSSLLRVGVRIDSKGAVGNWGGGADGNVLSLAGWWLHRCIQAGVRRSPLEPTSSTDGSLFRKFASQLTITLVTWNPLWWTYLYQRAALRTQGNILLTRSWFIINGYKSGTARWMQGQGIREGGGEVFLSNTWNPVLLGFSKRLHYRRMVDYFVGHWGLISTSSPSPLPDAGVGLKVPTF